MSDNSKKRKKDSDDAPIPKRPRFLGRPPHKIAAPSTTTAYPNGELNVSHFLRAHEYEIRALESAMKVAKKGLTRRAFQDVPRDLRRRTGSHNPQRVPKRLRLQARKEAKEDNTPISKNKSGSGIGKGKKKWLRIQGLENKKKARRKKKVEEPNKVTITNEPVGDKHVVEKDSRKPTKVASKHAEARTKRKKTVKLASPSMLPSRFRRRQLHKTWLPTHVWHAKRATMTPPKEPLWRFSIPLSPIVKGYRLTHRAASLRGAVAWDTSYVATMGLEGVEASVIGLLKALHFTEEVGEDCWQETRRGRKWLAGVRAREGWVYERDSKPLKKIAPITVIWRADQDVTSNRKKAMMRVHPTAFFQLWNEVIRASRVQKPSVTVEDLRFEIGSIEATGPAAAETLRSILTPSSSLEPPADAPQSVWSMLAPVTDVGVLPADALLIFTISDPRLRDPSKTACISQDPDSQVQLSQALADWPIDKTPVASQIFDRNARLAASRTLPSQKSINRRKSAASPGQHPEARTTDPHIPVLIHVSRAQNRWTVLLPWKCVLPVWQCMMRYPVSTGGNPRFGGLKETRQVSYERSMPSFPFDFPGTDAGWTWEVQQREVRQKEWTKKPKGKRIEWTSIDLGNGRKGEVGDPWACDWTELLGKAEREAGSKTLAPSAPYRQLHPNQAARLIAGLLPSTGYSNVPHLFTVKINMVQHGVPTECARIYRLSTTNAELRTKWLSLMPSSSQVRTPKGPAKKDPNPNPNSKSEALTKHLRARTLAAGLLEPKASANGPLKAGSEDYPVVPDQEDLIGFVTTGNYNLAEGMPSAIANIALHKVLEVSGTEAVNKDRHVCIVREAGRTFGSMSEDRAADGQANGVVHTEALLPGALAELIQDTLEDVLHTAIRNTVLSCHRSEKLLRMQSAATQAESLALSNIEPQSQTKANGATAVPTADTTAAKYENGRVFLKGNPLQTTPEIVCPHCKLPRLMYPIMGKGMQKPDLTREYCKKYPFVQEKGHDVYGNPFPTDMAKSKKERELIKQQQKNADKESVGTPGSQDTDMPGGESQGKEIKLNTGGKPASYIPWHTCPRSACKRSILITRFAHHLEKCLGISGRQSSRNAMAKLAGQEGNGTGMGNTPLGSRMGTPAPGSQGDSISISKVKGKGVSPVKKLGDDDEEGENDTPERKKKKKSSYVKKADREKMAKEGGTTLKVKLKANSASRESLKDSDRKMREGSEKPEKRERDEDSAVVDGAPKAKKIKLSLGKGDSGSVPPREDSRASQEAV
ncbi:hypothetical protein K491DRAFT_623087 [Lophiostoma macrostomum CBS 122681]|uniref:SAGA-associated factor 11 n=1 Tax=Lophiostoma macrostomum CBS 122681 TaxID=1314788 RepID=A0A6A6THS4_9PLEO|nr:hypothetical protein K491DRAFT_623087 [Lophiostoma macrostomum CBS 122681]